MTVIGSRRERASRADALASLPDLIEIIVVAVRAGATPVAAFELASGTPCGALAGVLGDIAHRLARGQRLADALSAFTDALGPQAALFTDTLATVDRYGLPIAPALDRLSDDIRAERRARAEQSARTLPVKLAFPLVVCTLPSFVLLAIVPAVLGAVSTLRGNPP